jgi:hypothetical protein
MNTITENTSIIITEIKRGHASGKSYETTAGRFIEIIKNKDCDGDLNVGVEPIAFDEDGDVVDFSADKFYNLPVAEQLDMCCRREGDSMAADISYTVAAE